MVLAAALLFNLGQGVLRPILPLYLQHVFAANYQMVTLIPVVFGAGKWVASLPTALIGDRVAPPLQGVAIGWLRTMTDNGQILGPLVMGVLADAVHLSTLFLLAAALVSVLAWRCHRQASPEHPHGTPVDAPQPTPPGCEAAQQQGFGVRPWPWHDRKSLGDS
jgi:MFS family permease